MVMLGPDVKEAVFRLSPSVVDGRAQEKIFKFCDDFWSPQVAFS